MRWVVIYCVLFCLLVFSSSRGAKASRNFRQLERLVRRATEQFIFLTSNDPDPASNEKSQLSESQIPYLQRRGRRETSVQRFAEFVCELLDTSENCF
jgi:hypothetical protein